MSSLRTNWLVGLALLAVPLILYAGVITTRSSTDTGRLVGEYAYHAVAILALAAGLLVIGRAIHRARSRRAAGR